MVRPGYAEAQAAFRTLILTDPVEGADTVVRAMELQGIEVSRLRLLSVLAKRLLALPEQATGLIVDEAIRALIRAAFLVGASYGIEAFINKKGKLHGTNRESETDN